jgi:hypothetical protein
MMYKEIKSSEVKETLQKLFQEKNWKRIKVIEQSLEDSITPYSEERTMYIPSPKFHYFFNGYEITAKETSDFGGKEPKYIVDEQKDVIFLSCVDKKYRVEIRGQKAFDGILTFAEAQENWGLGDSTLREAVRNDRFHEGEIRKSGGTWLITEAAMRRLYGEKKRKEGDSN